MNDFAVGQRLGDYEILDMLGAGGMGKVYKVKNVISERIEAMKIVLPDMAGQQERADRFLREIKLLAKLDHPNIAQLRTALTLENQLVMIMEFVEGVTFSTRLRQGPIPAAEACNYADQVLAALSYAHRQNIIHRDIKPANMMLTPQGIVKLMDFGLARSVEDGALTSTRTTMGSLYYMAPEQVRGEPADARSDIYSLGASLYEMVTAHPPFQSDSSYALMEAHLKTAPRPPVEVRPDLPIGLSQIILMALEKDPAKRFQTADAFRNALKSVAVSAPAELPRPELERTVPLAPVAGGATATFQEGHSPTIAAAAANPSPPAATVQPAVLPQPPGPRTQRASRTPYIVLGAAIVVVVLVAAGLYVPRRMKTSASGNGGAQSALTPAVSTPSSGSSGGVASQDTAGMPSQPSSPSATSPSSTPPSSPNPVAGATSSAPSSDASAHVAAQSGGSAAHSGLPSSKGSPAANRLDHRRSGAAHRGTASSTSGEAASGATQQADSQASPQTAESTAEPTPDPQLVEQLEQEMDHLTARSAAVQSSIDSLKNQQAASGYGLRGDIAASDQLMQTYMSRAQAADQAGDLKAKKKYLDLAEAEIGKLEKFLGH
jgi:eukaryotic-like serine/threonine-protein kinase